MRIRNYLLSIALTIASITMVYGYSDRSQDFDNTLTQGIQYSYLEPRKILLTQIEGRYEQLALNPEQLLDTIYYYSITKLKLGHMPFHYAIDESGNIYKTGKYDLVQITDEPYIVVGYLSNNGQLSKKAQSSILEIVDDLSYTHGIGEYDVQSLSISKGENGFSKLLPIKPSTLFTDSIDVALKDWEPYEREHKEYQAEVISVEHPESISIPNTLDVKVTIKNLNDFIWTSSKYPIYISTADSKDTVFSINETWDSFSRPTHLSSDEYVLPGENLELTFGLDPKVVPGEYSQSFKLLKFNNEPFLDSEFTIKFDVKKGDRELVMISSPEAGYVNIRNCRRFSCEQVDVVNHGEVYPVVEYHESCWYKIRYAEGKEGWFYCPYAKKVE